MENKEESIKDPANSGANKILLLKVAIRGIFKQISSGVSLERFTELFGEVLQDRPSAIPKLWAIYQQKIFDYMMNEIEEFIIDENLEEKFALLSKLEEESKIPENTKAWRPATGDIKQQLLAHDMQEKLKRKAELEEFVLAKEMKVNCLRMQVAAGRANAERIGREVDEMNKKLEAEAAVSHETIHAMRALLEDSSQLGKS